MSSRAHDKGFTMALDCYESPRLLVSEEMARKIEELPDEERRIADSAIDTIRAIERSDLEWSLSVASAILEALRRRLLLSKNAAHQVAGSLVGSDLSRGVQAINHVFVSLFPELRCPD